jgi:hypothetical protein
VRRVDVRSGERSGGEGVDVVDVLMLEGVVRRRCRYVQGWARNVVWWRIWGCCSLRLRFFEGRSSWVLWEEGSEVSASVFAFASAAAAAAVVVVVVVVVVGFRLLVVGAGWVGGIGAII